MAAKKKTSRASRRKPSGVTGKLKQFLGPRGLAAFRFIARVFWSMLAFQAVVVFLVAFMNPPPGYYMISEGQRLGGYKREWVDLEDMPPDMARAVVAAEDANFCNHWGFDLDAIRAAVSGNDGRLRGASTISQQVTKNVFLWPARTWIRKALEAEMTIYVEMFWSKRRIIEVYLNVAEFDEGVFGVGAAAAHYFGAAPADLTLLQAARLAAILPNPKDRSAINPSGMTRARTAQIMDGARTIAADGRDSCFVKTEE